MYRRSLAAPKRLKEGEVSASLMYCAICEDSGYYSLENIMRHPGWCPGQPPVAAAAAEAEREERRGAVEVDPPRQQVSGRAPLPAAERARHAAEAERALRGLRELAAAQQRERTPSAILDLRTASASGSSAATPAAASPCSSTSSVSVPASGSTTGSSALGDSSGPVSITGSASPAGTGSVHVSMSSGPGGASQSPAARERQPGFPSGDAALMHPQIDAPAQ